MMAWLQRLADVDPSPFFAVSLLPYLLFLRLISRSRSVHPLSLLGFQLTLLFVVVTIGAAIIALTVFDSELVGIDSLHGGAEAFLTLSNALVVAGLLRRLGQTTDVEQGE